MKYTFEDGCGTQCRSVLVGRRGNVSIVMLYSSRERPEGKVFCAGCFGRDIP